MLFADMNPVDPAQLATAGTPYVLAVCLLAVSTALVWVYRTYRGDVRDMLASHELALKEKRTEFVAEVESLADRHDAAEGRWRQDMQQQRAEFTGALKEITTTFAVRMDRLETKLFGVGE